MLAKTGDNPEGTEQATSADVEKKIPPRVLQKLMKDIRIGQDDIDSVRGTMGSAVAKATEKYSFNKKMFGWIRQLDRMSPEKLNDNLADHEYMLDASGLNERAKNAQRLPIEDRGGAEEE